MPPERLLSYQLVSPESDVQIFCNYHLKTIVVFVISLFDLVCGSAFVVVFFVASTSQRGSQKCPIQF